MKRFGNIFHRKLPASTLIETITASVIFMIVFVMAMDTMTRLLGIEIHDADYLVMENEIKKCRRQITQNELRTGTSTYTYKWGEIEVTITNYIENVYQVDMKAVSQKRNRRIGYRYLQANP